MLEENTEQLNFHYLKKYRMSQEIFMKGSILYIEPMKGNEITKLCNQCLFRCEIFVMYFIALGISLYNKCVTTEYLEKLLSINKRKYIT